MDNPPTVPDGSSPLTEVSASSVYESDEFRLYCHKILPCSKRTPHDWASCHFAHPGEKAKRRNIRTHSYDCEMCPDVVKGVECKLGANCPHSHNVFESWLHPQKYRTMMCKDRDRCTRPVCFFAHGPHELRIPTDPAPLSQQLDRTVAAAVTAAHGVPNQFNTAAALVGAAGGGVAGSSMQNWQLMQNQLSELAHGSSNVSMQSSGMLGSGPSTPRMTPASSPAAPYLGLAASAALVSPAGTGLQQGSTSTGGYSANSMAFPGNNSMLCSPTSSSYGLAELAANDQVARMMQQAGPPAVACFSASSPHAGVSMQHLLQSMAQQVNVSRQEAQKCRDVAMQAQQQLAVIMTALGPHSAAVASSTGTPAAGPPLGWQPQQMHTDSACASNNRELYRDGSDLSSNLTYLDRSSSTLPDISSGASTHQQLFSAAVPVSGSSAWRCDSGSGLMFMSELCRSGSESGPVGGSSRVMHTMSNEMPVAVIGPQGCQANSILASPDIVSAAISLQQQQLQVRQASGGPAGDAGGPVAGLVGAQGGLSVINRQQQQLMQQAQAYQQASGMAAVAGAGQAVTAETPPTMFRM